MEKSPVFNEKKRLVWIDCMRGFLCLCVVLNHSFPPLLYRKLYTPFFLSLFFWISGYTFSEKESWKQFLLSKTRRLLIPFFSLGLIRIVMTYILEGGDVGDMLHQFLKQVNCKGDEMWFLSCLFVSLVMFRLLIEFTRNVAEFDKFFLAGSVLICSALGYADICWVHIKIPWEIELAFFMLFFIYLGYQCKIHVTKFELAARKNIMLLLLPIYVIGTVLLCGDSDIHAERIQEPFSFFVLMIVGGWLIIAMFRNISVPLLIGPLQYIGKNTIFLYAFGGLPRIILYPILIKTGMGNYCSSLICMFLAPVLLYIPCKIQTRFFPWMTGVKRDNE